MRRCSGAALPVHALAARLKDGELQRAVLHGGEDYELLFAAPESVEMPRKMAGVAITRIGRLTRRRAGESVVTLVATGGARRGWSPEVGSIFPERRKICSFE